MILPAAVLIVSVIGAAGAPAPSSVTPAWPASGDAAVVYGFNQSPQDPTGPGVSVGYDHAAHADPWDAVVSALAEQFIFRGPDDVRAFLTGHPDVVSLLAESREKIDAVFGAGTTVVVEVARDLETGGPEGELLASVQTTLDPREARALLQQLDEGWWLEALPRGGHRMTLTVEYA